MSGHEIPLLPVFDDYNKYKPFCFPLHAFSFSFAQSGAIFFFFGLFIKCNRMNWQTNKLKFSFIHIKTALILLFRMVVNI